MLELEVTIVNELGLHARAAAKLVRLSRTFASRITIEDRGENASANAKSILSILALAASAGSVVTVIADGTDEAAAIEAVCTLFTEGFGEI